LSKLSISLNKSVVYSTSIKDNDILDLNIQPDAPYQLNWKDRRPIIMVNLATIESSSPTNPRGWFNAKTADYVSNKGITQFHTDLLSSADKTIAEMTRIGAQGMVFWNPEGCQWANSSFIGDPTLTETLAPEMTGVIDQFFAKFVSAGFKVGCCLRPNTLSITRNLSTGLITATSQSFSPVPDEVLHKKAAYAMERWGCTIFYCDSTVQENYPGSGPTKVNPLPSTIFQSVASSFPNALFIPENEVDGDYQFTAPYNQLNQGWIGTPTNIRSLYPNSFSVNYIPDGNITANYDALVSSVKSGDILMCRGWFRDDPTNQLVIDIYKAATE